MEIEIKHTSQLSTPILGRVRSLLDVTFEGDFSEEDWQHSLGGMHILAWVNGVLVGHSCVIQRQLVYQGSALRTGYVEAVAVRPQQQRLGIGTSLMRETESLIRGAYELGMLGASEEGLRLYQKCGWLPWRGRALAFTPDGIIDTHEDSLYFLQVSTEINPDADIICEYRQGDLW